VDGQKGELGTLNKVVVEYPQGWMSGFITNPNQGIGLWRMDPPRWPAPPAAWATSAPTPRTWSATSPDWRSTRSAPTSEPSSQATSSTTTAMCWCATRAGPRASSTPRRSRPARRTPQHPRLRHQGRARVAPGGPQLPGSRTRPAGGPLLARQQQPLPRRQKYDAHALRPPRGLHRGLRQRLPGGFKTIRAQVAGDPDPKADHPTASRASTTASEVDEDEGASPSSRPSRAALESSKSDRRSGRGPRRPARPPR
jgi:hypothetical protein